MPSAFRLLVALVAALVVRVAIPAAPTLSIVEIDGHRIEFRSSVARESSAWWIEDCESESEAGKAAKRELRSAGMAFAPFFATPDVAEALSAPVWPDGQVSIPHPLLIGAVGRSRAPPSAS